MINDILEYLTIIQEINELLNNHFNEVTKVLSDQELQIIFNKYDQNKEEYKISGFNIFSLISDKYYYENFHSDIISVFLDKTGMHNEGDKFLTIFIGLIQKLKPELKINFEDFSNTCITREKQRIDILIQDTKSQKAIIIENKINNASDTYRQLPTYISKIGLENVVAIIYLPLEPQKTPDKTDWTKEEIGFIDSKLVCIPAFNRTDNDFFNGWLLSCIRQADDENVKTILKQYSKVILKIGGFIMDKILYEQFYNKVISNPDVFKTSLSIKTFVDNLPIYRAQRIYDIFIKDYSPFERLNQKDNVVLFYGYRFEERSFTIHVDCFIDKYEIRFWDENYGEIINGEQVNTKVTSKIISKLRSIKFEEQRVDEFVKRFSFPEEEQNLYDYLNVFKNELKVLS